MTNRTKSMATFVSLGAASLLALSACSSHDAQKSEETAADQVTQTDVADADERKVSDEEITTAVVTQFLVELGVPAKEVTVDTRDGVVRLSGSVDSILNRTRAEKVASRIKGVRGIVNQIEVDAPEIADAQLKSDVESALADGPATDAFEVVVLAQSGSIVLTGTVASYAEANLAETVAMSVRGVESVANKLEVDLGEERTDPDIKKEIRRRLAWDSRVDSAAIQIDVSRSEVILTGDVGSLYEAGIAQSLSWVRGVQKVNADRLEIAWWDRDKMLDRDILDARSDDAIEEAVRDSLMFDPRVKSYGITVASRDGEVTLTGTVDNLRAKEIAAQTAANVHGVWEINNALKLEPSFEKYVDATITESIERKLRNNGLTSTSEIDVSTRANEVTLTGSAASVLVAREARDIAATTPGVAGVDNNVTVATPRLSATDDAPTTDEMIAASIRDHIFWSPRLESEEIEVKVKDGVATLAGKVDTLGQRNVAIENAREGGAARVEASGLEVAYGPANLVPEGGVAYY